MGETLHTILLIDDEADIRLVARLAFEGFGGFEVEECASGEEALARAGELSPQLILLDHLMPGLDGLATLAGLREAPQLAQVPVIFLTGKGEPAEIDRFRAAGALDVIVKPFDPMAICDHLHAAWRRHLAASCPV
jgi:two-component system, OmpR family, response regulator